MKQIFANKNILFLTLSIFLFAGTNVLAATRIVTKLVDTNDGVCNADCSLREAVAVAANGDKIYFQLALSGTITLQHGSIDISKNITLNGSDTVSVSGNKQTRVFLVKSGATVVMNNMEVEGGATDALSPSPYGGLGGGIHVSGSTLYLNDSYIHDNQSFIGGGIHVGDSGFLKITDSEISANKSNTNSGGISCGISKLEISDSIITQNQAVFGSGGGLGTGSCDLTMTNTTVSQNTADSSNPNPKYGGGIYLEGANSTYKITNSSIINNLSAFGGGIYHKGKLYLINSTVSSNDATWNTGGVYSEGQTVVRNSTITLNHGALSIGGLRTGNNSDVYLSNTIISGNTNPQNASPEIGGTVKSFGYNIIGSTTGATILTFGINDKLNTNAMLGPLANNGGPTPTHLPQPGSPAINGGSNGLAVDASAQPLTIDQRGYARITGGTVDIGSVEISGRVVSSVSVSGKVTNVFGELIRKAHVEMIDIATGESRRVRTDAMGQFHFDDVNPGQTYRFEVSYKRYAFTPQAVFVTEEIGDLSFILGSRN